MTETSPKLEIGPAPESLRKERAKRSPASLLWVILLQLAVLALLIALWLRPADTPVSESAQEWRRTAQALEDRRLNKEAAAAWRQYQALAPGDDGRAAIWYRIGELHRKAEEWGLAASAFLQAEVGLPESSELRPKIGQAMVECLRRAGRTGEVGRELTRRVGGPEDQGEAVVARIGGEPLTEADLDRLIEEDFDRRYGLGGQVPTREEREAWLRRFEDPEARGAFLREWLQTELFARRALELDLDRDEAFERWQSHLEKQLLAGRFVDRELRAAQPTRPDLEAFYQQRLDRYGEPETLEVTLFELRSGEAAEEVLVSIDSADAFRIAARERAKTLEREEGWGRTSVVRDAVHPLLGRTGQRLFELTPGDWATEPLEDGGRRYLALIEDHRPAGPLPFERVEAQVRSDFAQEKIAERIEQLGQELMARYDAKIIREDEDG
ncbi:MAG: peptidylprolyl isomerase [Planctomycetota bacterium]